MRENYPRLANIWLSDVFRHKEQLEIDVLIGADYLWSFQSGNFVREGVGEPVAIETQLGWVVSGPLESSQSTMREQAVSVNLVGRDSIIVEKLEEDVQALWELETSGITEGDRVYKEFVDNIMFNGNRYSVKLSWKEGRDVLDSYSNYDLSLSRMIGHVKKLREEPEVLREYDSVIKEQLASGVIERVSGKTNRAHCIPHLAIIRKEASTTKLRVAYDASQEVDEEVLTPSLVFICKILRQ